MELMRLKYKQQQQKMNDWMNENHHRNGRATMLFSFHFKFDEYELKIRAQAIVNGERFFLQCEQQYIQ